MKRVLSKEAIEIVEKARAWAQSDAGKESLRKAIEIADKSVPEDKRCKCVFCRRFI